MCPKCISVVVITLLAALTSAHVCSEPGTGNKEPLPAEIVSLSDLVVVGEVSGIITLDPSHGDMYGNSTYGAMVTVHCTYKGGSVGNIIQIGAAGQIHGHCIAKHLSAGNQYVLFLSKPNVPNVYEQTYPAANRTKLGDFIRACKLAMKYPTVSGKEIQLSVCPPATQMAACNHGNALAALSSTLSLLIVLVIVYF